jgi:type I restriction enzyme M protein
MAEIHTQADINSAVWAACDTFRGAIDPAQYKDYILTMLFVKYLSDLRKELLEKHHERYKGDKTRIKRAMQRERFKVPEECDFDHLYAKRNAANIGELINIALEGIEDANKTKLERVFRGIDFNSETLGEPKDKNRRLKNLLDDFKKIDLQPSHLENNDIIGDVYEYLIARFAAGAGKKAGEFYTPAQVSKLLAKLVQPKPGDRICDPTCGSGSLLIKVSQEINGPNFSLYGQESNGSTWALSKMNMYLHGLDAARIEWGDTLNNPKLIEDDQLMKFNVVVANPPFSLDKWGAEDAEHDRFKRFWRGVPPKSKADYAFVCHMIETAVEDNGTVGVIVPHGVLFRGGKEGHIRRRLIEENYLDTVIGLPANLFYGTGIPTAILLFKKGRKAKDVLFIDASREFEQGKNQNLIRDEIEVAKIVATCHKRSVIDKYSYRAKVKEIAENDFNLNIPRYVDTFEEEEEVDIAAVQKNIDALENELDKVRIEMAKKLKELKL